MSIPIFFLKKSLFYFFILLKIYSSQSHKSKLSFWRDRYKSLFSSLTIHSLKLRSFVIMILNAIQWSCIFYNRSIEQVPTYSFLQRFLCCCEFYSRIVNWEQHKRLRLCCRGQTLLSELLTELKPSLGINRLLSR